MRSLTTARALFFHRVLASAEHRQVLHEHLQTVVDVGANRGQFALAARRWAPNSRIFSFEPLPEPAAKFRRLFRDDERVELHTAAIAPQSGKATIHVTADDDSSSLLAPTPLQKFLHAGASEVATVEAKCGPLDQFLSSEQINSPALLKLDVQGYELQALRGCEPLLSRFDIVVAECSFHELYEGQALAHEIIDFLDQRGFKLSSVYNVVYAGGRAVQAEFEFRSRSSRSSPDFTKTDIF